MINTIGKKRGRPAAVYKMADGTQVPGLSRKSDGRWKISATGQTFVEPDEGLAVARFHQITAKQRRSRIAVPSAAARLGDADDLRQALASVVPPAAEAKPPRNAEEWAAQYLPAEHPVGGATPVKIEIEDGRLVFYGDKLEEAAFWPWLRWLILNKSQMVAQKTGIEQIGYLADLPRPAPSPTLEEIGTLYASKPGLSANEASRSKLFWNEFREALDVASVREVTHDLVHRYEAKIFESNYAPKSLLHRVRKVRTILAYAMKRGRGVDDCRRALDCTAGIEVKKAQPLDPKPIEMAVFWKIYNAAKNGNDDTFAALMLAALNFAMYAGEVAAVKWEEVDLKAGELVTRRPKTGVSRVAVLWPETMKALKALPRVGDYAFNTRVRSYTVYSVLDKWRSYREALSLPEDTVFGQIRDASYSIACRSSNLDQARVLAGHRLPGMADHYVRRRPDFVRDACRAVHDAFHVRTRAKL